jgi:hypothetical protein
VPNGVPHVPYTVTGALALLLVVLLSGGRTCARLMLTPGVMTCTVYVNVLQGVCSRRNSSKCQDNLACRPAKSLKPPRHTLLALQLVLEGQPEYITVLAGCCRSSNRVLQQLRPVAASLTKTILSASPCWWRTLLSSLSYCCQLSYKSLQNDRTPQKIQAVRSRCHTPSKHEDAHELDCQSDRACISEATE